MLPGAEDPFRSSSNETRQALAGERSGLYLYKPVVLKFWLPSRRWKREYMAWQFKRSLIYAPNQFTGPPGCPLLRAAFLPIPPKPKTRHHLYIHRFWWKLHPRHSASAGKMFFNTVEHFLNLAFSNVECLNFQLDFHTLLKNTLLYT